MRPPLSKEMWYGDRLTSPDDEDVRFKQWNGKERSVFFEPPAFYTDYARLNEGEDDGGRGGIAVLTGRRVTRIDADKQVATLDNGRKVKYEKCLLATGGKPKSLPVFDRNDRLKSKVKKDCIVFSSSMLQKSSRRSHCSERLRTSTAWTS